MPSTARHRDSLAGSRPRGGVAVAAARVLGAVLSFALLLGFGYGWYEYRSLRSGMQTFRLNAIGKDPNSGEGGADRHAAGFKNAQNILLVGIDTRTGLSAAEQHRLKVGGGTSMATDTIMVLHVPAGGRRATMISIPRDSYVDIQGYAKNKINAAYGDAYGDAVGKGASEKQAERAGADLLIQTVSDFTGLRIDHYVQIGFGGLYTIAKALHGIPVNLCAATDDSFTHNRLASMQGGSGFKMSAGHHDLTPLQAFEFVRQRHFLPHEDIDRERRQRYFLTAAFDKIASAHVLLNPSRLSSLIKAVQGAFFTDDKLDLVKFAGQLSDLSANQISGFTIPFQGYQDVSIVGSTQNVVIVDPQRVQAAIQKRLTRAPAKPSSPSSRSSSKPASRGTATKGCVY
jgi:LCP family protein required for cell wall assembly